jgi:excisionase family DNA binding protein
MKSNQNTIHPFVMLPIPLEEFQHAIKESIKEAFKDSETNSQTQTDDLITSTEAANLLGVSKVTLHNWKVEGLISYYRIGTRIRFKKSEVIAALKRPKNRKG